jgi:hypothetical protein
LSQNKCDQFVNEINTLPFVDEDPREALLKYAAVSEDDPLWVNKGKQAKHGSTGLIYHI